MIELIYKRLWVNQDLREKVAGIYYDKGDYDTRDRFYPHIILSAERFSDALHGVAGLLSVDIICAGNSIPPEEIEKLVRKSLENVFFKSQKIFILTWNKSEKFEERASETTPLIIGMTVFFEIRELPDGITATPDAIYGLQQWLSDRLRDAVIIGLTDFGEIFEPSEEVPAIWLSQTSLKLDRFMAETAFVTADINVHVFAPNVENRRQWLMSLYHELIFVKAIPLSDGVMRLQDLNFDFTADALQGQLKSTWEFGIFPRRIFAHPLNKLETEHGGKIKRYDNYLVRRLK